MGKNSEAILKAIEAINKRLDAIEKPADPPKDPPEADPDPPPKKDPSKPDDPQEGAGKTKPPARDPSFEKEKADLLKDLKALMKARHGDTDLSHIETLEDARKHRAYLEKNKVGLKSLDEMNEKKTEPKKKESTGLRPDLSALKAEM